MVIKYNIYRAIEENRNAADLLRNPTVWLRQGGRLATQYANEPRNPWADPAYIEHRYRRN